MMKLKIKLPEQLHSVPDNQDCFEDIFKIMKH